MDVSEKLVSILIPVHNAEQHLVATLESALSQTYSTCEIIAIDDGSIDGSIDILQSYGDRISWASQESKGQAVTRNRLLAKSRGTFLQFLDADDIIAPNKISAQVNKLAEEPDADLCLDGMRLFYSDLNDKSELFPCPTDEDQWVSLITISFPFTSAGLWRRTSLEALGGWRERIITGHEYDRYFRLLQAERKICFLSDARTFYRMPSRFKPNTRNPVLTLRERLDLLNEVETHLRITDSLTRARRLALAMTRLQIARQMWPLHRLEARDIAQRIAAKDVVLERASPAVPISYLCAYKTLGFKVAQHLSDVKSSLRNKLFVGAR
jgi:glycosyltransferase involved in cell wall biosynthesis